MKILAIETATESCSCALMHDNQITEKYIIAAQSHAQRLLSMIDELLCEADVSLSQLDALAFGCGPGSFTGLRIAASMAQGLALSVDLPVVPVSTLACLAQTAVRVHNAEHVLVAIDARMQEVYWGEYQLAENGLMQVIQGDALVSPDKLNVLTQISQSSWAVGNAWGVYADTMAIKLPRMDPALYPHAQDMLHYASSSVSNNATIAPELALPVYLRNQVTHEGSSHG